MRYSFLLAATITGAALPALSAPAEQAVCDRLAAGLRDEVQLLSGITDNASADAAAQPLARVLADLAALNAQVDEKELWLYIDNTPGIKQPLLEEIERLFVQLQRLEKAEFFHSRELSRLLTPIVTPRADKKTRRTPSAEEAPADEPAQHP